MRCYSKWLGIFLVCIGSVAAQQSDFTLPRSPLNLDFTGGTEGAAKARCADVEVHGSNVDRHGPKRPQSYFLRYREICGAGLRMDPA